MARRQWTLDRKKIETITEEGEDNVQQVSLVLAPGQLPKLTVTDDRGVRSSKCVGLVDLLKMIDHSTTVDALIQEDVKRTPVPKLPNNVVKVDILDTPSETMVAMSGWIPDAVHMFTIKGVQGAWALALPPIVYTAMWSKNKAILQALDIAMLRDDVEDLGFGTGLNARLWRWPFSNVYTYGVGTSVCWYTMDRVSMELCDVPRLGVGGFLNVPNVPDLYGVGVSQQSEHHGLAEFFDAVDNEGLREEWLIPHDETLGQVHERRVASY